MGKKGPRRGSLAFWHRKRATKLAPRITTWNYALKGISGFAGYKAGMLHLAMTDDSESPTKGQEIVRAATVVEVPPLFVYQLNAYQNSPYGIQRVATVTALNAPKELNRAHNVAKKSKTQVSDVDAKAATLSEVRVVCMTQPWKCELKKTPELFELAIGGTVAEQLTLAKELLGKELPVSQVLQEGEYLDAVAVSTGKGWQGVVKRFGVALNPHKATKSRRHGGSIGAETPARVFFTVPRAGQTGYHKRTDFNKRLLKVGSLKDVAEVTPKSKFNHYGELKSDFIVVDGSIPGPAKRLIRFRKSIRVNGKVKKPEIKEITLDARN